MTKSNIRCATVTTTVNMEEHKQRLVQLDATKREIENKISAQKAILDANNIGMDEPLIDSQGFPRSDIDVYKVRHARHNIICLMNDHKAIMREIETALHRFHGSVPSASANHATSSVGHGLAGTSGTEKPFAVITDVEEGSPAQLAGLRSDDLIVKFGSVNGENFKNVNDIAAVVRHSVGKPLNISVKRRSNILPVVLTPKPWAGKGMLGFKFNSL
ncbi:26S proteasome non-ATPase regulatory subunit 9-like [Ornithodoros turicata]|uniref:26S proteasome non-ATPase regulatory subunit 9-like n=1 Tax=Ornithodoros turicata TaxID=34597 RepID=UPI0031389C00